MDLSKLTKKNLIIIMNTKFDLESENWDKEEYRVERAKSISNQILKAINIDKESQILDFGSGTGLLGFNFITKCNCVTFADTSAGMLKQVELKARASGQLNYKTLDLNEYQIDESYDVILSLMTLHHVELYKEAILDLVSKVKDNGYICLSDLELEDGTFHYPEVVPHNGFDRLKMAELLKSKGLTIQHNEIGFVNKKNVNGKLREYPVFIVIGKKN